jgi:hypothetical protein
VGIPSKGTTEVEVTQVRVFVNENVEEIAFPYDVFRGVAGRRTSQPYKGGEEIHRDERSTEGKHVFGLGIWSGIVEIEDRDEGCWRSISITRALFVEEIYVSYVASETCGYAAPSIFFELANNRLR